jgi:hypothetical protein
MNAMTQWRTAPGSVPFRMAAPPALPTDRSRTA